ncbi:MAG: RNA polymerase sigma factor [Pseudomonadota bacterium]|uniref:RNA polymerase sigma factor n=1 Tax=Sphingomonas sp. ERG5 TaxID=1381597 RepID=UPI0009DCBCAF|nr:RNA polymerase sigma factor [Sphingomonas sp. ERG5]
MLERRQTAGILACEEEAVECSDGKRDVLHEQTRMLRLHGRFRVALQRYFSRRVGSRPDVDDLVQDVFERLMRRGPVRNDEEVDAYVFTTANNVLIDSHRRKQARCERQHQQFLPDVHGDADFSSEDVTASKEQLARVSTILHELPERTRTIFILRRLENMRYGEIARHLGISLSTTEKHMQRAMLHVSSRMNDDDQR